MGHHFSFFYRHRKTILVVLALGVILAIFFALLIGLLLFKVIIPAILGSIDHQTVQASFELVKNWLVQLTDTNPMQWLNLLLQAE